MPLSNSFYTHAATSKTTSCIVKIIAPCYAASRYTPFSLHRTAHTSRRPKERRHLT